MSVFFSRVWVFETYTNILLLLWRNSDIFLQSSVIQQLYTILQTILSPSTLFGVKEKRILLRKTLVWGMCPQSASNYVCVNYTVKIHSENYNCLKYLSMGNVVFSRYHILLSSLFINNILSYSFLTQWCSIDSIFMSFELAPILFSLGFGFRSGLMVFSGGLCLCWLLFFKHFSLSF